MAIAIALGTLVNEQWIGYLIGILITFTLGAMSFSLYSGKSLILAVFISIMVGILSWGIVRAVKYQDTPNDSYSKGRLTQLSEVLTSIFGPKWPYILMIFALFFTCILYFIYKSTIDINLTINCRYTFWISIIFLIGMFVWAGIAFRHDNPALVGDFAPSGQIVEIIGLITVIICVVFGSIIFYKKF